MIWKVFKRSFIAFVMILTVISCDQNILGPLEHNSNAPGMVTVSATAVENTPGGAKITYSLPSDQDLLYVKAVYTLADGKSSEVKAAYYSNNIEVKGFFDMNEHEVKLYSVNRSGVESAPVSVTIKPLEANIWGVFRSIKAVLSPSNVSIDISSNNVNNEAVSLLIKEKNKTTGEWELISTVATSLSDIYKSLGSADNVYGGVHELAIYVRDRWLNITPAYNVTITTIGESAIPKNQYSTAFCNGDTAINPDLVKMSKYNGMWDDRYTGWPGAYLTVTNDNSKPNTVTINVGELAQLTHITIWDYPEYGGPSGGPVLYYNRGNLKEFEIWGTDKTPAADGSYSSPDWHLLGKYNAVKDSGLPFGTISNTDFDLASAGFNWYFDIAQPKVKYIKIVSIKNWAGDQCISISEIQIYKTP